MLRTGLWIRIRMYGSSSIFAGSGKKKIPIPIQEKVPDLTGSGLTNTGSITILPIQVYLHFFLIHEKKLQFLQFLVHCSIRIRIRFILDWLGNREPIYGFLFFLPEADKKTGLILNRNIR